MNSDVLLKKCVGISRSKVTTLYNLSLSKKKIIASPNNRYFICNKIIIYYANFVLQVQFILCKGRIWTFIKRMFLKKNVYSLYVTHEISKPIAII